MECKQEERKEVESSTASESSSSIFGNKSIGCQQQSNNTPNWMPLQQGFSNPLYNPFMMPSLMFFTNPSISSGSNTNFNNTYIDPTFPHSQYINNNVIRSMPLPTPNMFSMMVPSSVYHMPSSFSNNTGTTNNINNNICVDNKSSIEATSEDVVSSLLSLSKSFDGGLVNGDIKMMDSIKGGGVLDGLNPSSDIMERKVSRSSEDDDDFKFEVSDTSSSRRGRPQSSCSSGPSHKKTYDCPHCDYSTWRSGNFRVHMRRHSGEKPFKCDFPGCNYSSSQHSNLKIHNRIHFDFKPFKCSFENCKFESVQRSNLNAHEKRIHFKADDSPTAPNNNIKKRNRSKSKKNNNKDDTFTP